MSEVAEVKDVPIEELSQPEFKAARAKGQLTVEKPAVEPEEPAEKVEEKPKKSGGGFQKKIDRLIKQNAMLAEELERTRTAKAEPEKKQETKSDDEPKRENYQTDAEWVKAQARWEARQELREERAREAQQAEADQQKEVLDAYNERVAEAKAKYDDWDEVVGQNINIPWGSEQAITEMDNGPDVAYYLGMHPEVCQDLLENMSVKRNGKVYATTRGIAKLWSISEQLGGEGKKEEETEEPEEKVEEEKPAKPVSKAPTPIKPLGSGSTKSSVPLDKMSMADYKKARAAGRTH